MGLPIDTLEPLLRRAGHSCHRLSLGPACQILLTDRGGRLFGPFLHGQDALGWTPDEAEMTTALDQGGWNIGGERIWIAPERHFHYSDPARMLETYRVDARLDPGSWQLEMAAQAAVFSTLAEIPLSDRAEVVRVSLRRLITVLPPRREGPLSIFAYRQRVDLLRKAGPDLPLIPWILRQLSPVGMAYIMARAGARAATVFGDAPDSALIPTAGFWRVPFQGPGFFKTAYHRADLGWGRLGLILPEEPAIALDCLPNLGGAASYPESLPLEASATGQGASLFYDSGRFGAYGEVELYGHHSARSGGRVEAETQIIVGPKQALTAHLGLS